VYILVETYQKMEPLGVAKYRLEKIKVYFFAVK
jgi:hypothetical protein